MSTCPPPAGTTRTAQPSTAQSVPAAQRRDRRVPNATRSASPVATGVTPIVTAVATAAPVAATDIRKAAWKVAVAADAALILLFVEALADYEKLRHEAQATEADILRDLFGASPKVFAELAFSGDRPVGFALWYYTYSTFQGCHGIWLEDLFVDPEARGNVLGIVSPYERP